MERIAFEEEVVGEEGVTKMELEVTAGRDEELGGDAGRPGR